MHLFRRNISASKCHWFVLQSMNTLIMLFARHRYRELQISSCSFVFAESRWFSSLVVLSTSIRMSRKFLNLQNRQGHITNASFQKYSLYFGQKRNPGLYCVIISSEWVDWMPISEEMNKLNLIPAIKTYEFVSPIASKYNFKSILFIIVIVIRNKCTAIGNRLIEYFDKFWQARFSFQFTNQLNIINLQSFII